MPFQVKEQPKQLKRLQSMSFIVAPGNKSVTFVHDFSFEKHSALSYHYTKNTKASETSSVRSSFFKYSQTNWSVSEVDNCEEFDDDSEEDFGAVHDYDELEDLILPSYDSNLVLTNDFEECFMEIVN